jgi:hypothetical protein
MYTLACEYYKKSFDSLDELIEDVQISGMDPSYEVLKNGVGLGETVWDFISE